MNLAIIAGKNMAQLTADFAPIPWMGPAVGAVITLMQMCQNVTSNRRAASQLANRCVILLESLKACAPYSNSQSPPDRVADAFQSILRALQEIDHRMQQWATLPKPMAFIKQNEILDSMQKSHLLLDDCTRNFQLIADIESHNWQKEFQHVAAEDHMEILTQLSNISEDQQLTNQLLNRNSDQIGTMLQMMSNIQAGLDNFNVGDRRHTGLVHGLRDLTRTSGQLLPDYKLNQGEVRRIGSCAKGASASMDIWEGLYLDSDKVCIKIVRGVDLSEKTIERFRREVKIWRDVWEIDRGKHTLTFLGMCDTDGKYPYMVSPWMENGDAITYVRKHPEVNRKKLIWGIAKGLKMLHELEPYPIVHGDMKGANVIINDYGVPLIADFGMAKILQNVTGIPFTQSRGISESYRWFAPELATEPGELSIYSDVFSFSMTILELMTGDHPFVEIRRTPEVLLKLVDGYRPRRPTDSRTVARGLNDDLWRLLWVCWDPKKEPEQRPSMEEVCTELERLASQ